MSQLELKVEEAGNAFLIKPRGLIDIITSPELDHCIDSLMSKNHFNIIVDMNKTSYISSSGWGIFIGSLRKIKENGGDIVFINMQPEIRAFFNTLDLPSKFHSFASRTEAIAHFSN